MTTDHGANLASPASLEFPEFTSKLVTDTFDALVSSMIRQQIAYADLVEKVAMSINDFEAEMVPEEEVDDWLASNGIDLRGEPVELTKLQIEALGRRLGPVAARMDDVTLPSAESLSGDNDTLEIDGAQIEGIRKAIRRSLAEPRRDALQELVSQGIVRIVVEDGTIDTSLRFETWSTENTTSSYSNTTTDRYGGSVKMKGGFLNKWFGLSGNAYKHTLSVTTNDIDTERDSGAEATMTGRVTINFRGDYRPLAIGTETTEDAPMVVN